MAGRGSLRLFFIRHGEVAGNRDLAFIGRRDDPLTPTGIEQATALGAAFDTIPIDQLLSSPLRRCLETAEHIARTARRTPVVDARLIEQSFGRWDGLTPEAIAERGAEDLRRLKAWQGDPSGAPPGGESLRSVQRRILELVEELVAGEARSVALVSHVSPIKAVVCRVLGLSLSGVRRLFLDPASITIVDWSAMPVLRLFNAHAQLDWQQERWLDRPPEDGLTAATPREDNP